jgi:3-hexulose-6-phosphate synthase
LQVALDSDFGAGLSILRAVHPYISIAEIGTPFVFREGIAAAHHLCQAFPEVTLLADFKIMPAKKKRVALSRQAATL